MDWRETCEVQVWFYNNITFVMVNKTKTFESTKQELSNIRLSWNDNTFK